MDIGSLFNGYLEGDNNSYHIVDRVTKRAVLRSLARAGSGGKNRANKEAVRFG